MWIKTLILSAFIFSTHLDRIVGQTIPKLDPPITISVEEDMTLEELQVATINFAVQLSDVIARYQQFAIDETMSEQLSDATAELSFLISNGRLVERLPDLVLLQNWVRNIISDAIIYEKELLKNEEEIDAIFNNVHQLKQNVEPTEIITNKKNAALINSFEHIELFKNRLEIKTGTVESFSGIQFSKEFDKSADFYLETFIQLKDFSPLQWDPSLGLIFGSDSDTNFYVYKINFIDKSVDFIGHNFEDTPNISYNFPVANLNSPQIGNKLSVYRKGEVYHFFLNNELIFEVDRLYMYGKYIGIAAESGLHLSISDFKMYQK